MLYAESFGFGNTSPNSSYVRRRQLGLVRLYILVIIARGLEIADHSRWVCRGQIDVVGIKFSGRHGCDCPEARYGYVLDVVPMWLRKKWYRK